MRKEFVLYVCAGVIVGYTLTLFTFHTVIEQTKSITQRRESSPWHVRHSIQKTRKGAFTNVRPSGTKLLCWILTQQKNFNNKTQSVKETWSKRCDITLFFSSVSNMHVPTIKLDVPEGRRNLANKSMSALRYIYKHYYEVADWFFKADDDTYVIVENLRHFLSKHDPYAPFYYGRILNNLDEAGYNSGGAGYVMGKEALKRLAVHGTHMKVCNRGTAEDMIVGRCLRALGVGVGRATDKYGRPIFNFLPPYAMIIGRNPKWTYGRTYVGEGADSVSQIAASFHYVNPSSMRAIDFLLYNVTVHGYNKPKRTDLL